MPRGAKSWTLAVRNNRTFQGAFMFRRLMKLDHTGLLLDVVLVLLVVAVFVSDDIVIAFHGAFVVVVLASIRVGLTELLLRGIPTGIAVLIGLLIGASNDEVPVEELFELPLLGAVVVMVYVSATRRKRLTDEVVEQGTTIEEMHRAGQRELQDQLLLTQRLQVNDRLNAAVAHDVNNILSAIQMSAENLTDGAANPREVMTTGRALEQRVGEAAAVLGELIESARITNSSTPQPPADLVGAVDAFEPLLRRLCSRNIQLRVSHCGETARLQIPRIRLGQILVNLVINAVDAASGSEATIEIDTCLDGDDGIITVTDNGPGISPGVVGQIFEPFYTSKAGEGGTGLGLFAVRELLEDVNGSVTVDTAVGEGARFELRIPTLNENVEAAVDNPVMSPSVRRVSLRVLVADDDVTIRESLARSLRSAGHYVTTAVDGDDARSLIESFDGSLDVLIADVMMPGVSGIDLARGLQMTNPDLPIILMSGYERISVDSLDSPQSICFRHKPFAIADMLTDLQYITSKQPQH